MTLMKSERRTSIIKGLHSKKFNFIENYNSMIFLGRLTLKIVTRKDFSAGLIFLIETFTDTAKLIETILCSSLSNLVGLCCCRF